MKLILILKSQQRFVSEKHNAFTEEINKFELRINYDKRIQSIDHIETCIYVICKDILHKS